MDAFLEMFTHSTFWFAVIRVTTPILFATLGAVIASKSGAINIGIEGIMLTSAFCGVLFSAFTQNVWVGLLVAVIAGMIMASTLAYFSLKLSANIILTGIAINILAGGGTVFLLDAITGDKGISTSLNSLVLPELSIPIVRSIPYIGDILSGHNILTYFSWICILLIHILLNHTSLGLRIQAVGESPESAESVGINVFKIKFIALVLSGMLASFGGAFLSMGYVSWFSSGMTAGRGYIALAARAIAGNTALGSLLASLLFGTAETLSNHLQSFNVPVEFVHMTPYAITIIGFIVISIINDKQEDKRKRKQLQ